MKKISISALLLSLMLITPVFANEFNFDLDKTVYGEGENVKYFEWIPDSKENLTFEEVTTPTEGKITIEYHYGSDYTTVYDNEASLELIRESLGDKYYAGGTIKLKEGETTSLTNILFINNNVNITKPQERCFLDGGAIYNKGNIKEITADFIGNSVSSSTRAKGGGIYNGGTIGNITGDFIANSSDWQGGAIYNDYHAAIGDIIGNFIENHVSTSSYSNGGVIYNNSIIENIAGQFIGNYAYSSGYITYGGVIYNDRGSIGDITADFIGNYAISTYYGAYGGAIYNVYGNIGNITGAFIKNYVSTSADSNLAEGGAIFNNGTIGNITADFIENYAINHRSCHYPITGGAIHNSANGTIGAKDSEGNVVGGIINSNFYDNYVQAKSSALGGAIYTVSDLNIIADKGSSTFKGNYVQVGEGEKDYQAIYVSNSNNTQSALNFISRNGGSIYMYDNINGDEGYTVNISGDGTGSFNLYNDIYNANVNLGNTTLSTINDLTYTNNFNKFTLTDNANMLVDVDLASREMDRITAGEYGEHTGTLTVSGMNLLSDSQDEITEIMFAEEGLKDHVQGALTLPDKHQTAYTPIYKYDVTYDNREDGGYFLFDRKVGGGSTNPSDAFNPSVLVTPSAVVQAGAYTTQTQTFNYAFQNADNFMNIPYLERVAIKNQNKYAMSPTGDATDVGNFSPIFTKPEGNSVWFKPYASFESIPLKNGPKVDNINYGSLIGFDSELKEIRGGFDRVMTYYIGYNGSYQSYNGVNSTQNGGLVGTTATLYKGNFFNATTLSVGASAGNNDTMYGHENFALLLAGIGNKTGYNLEFKEGRIILQPNFLISYTFVNTFDYTNAAGVKIKSDPLNAIQLAPGLKLIGNTKTGWQPYASVSMVWNLLDKSKVTADSVRLPEMSIKPYVQYGLGVQKRFKDRFLGFGQAMIQNGGRNGVSLSFGLRMML